MMPSLRIPGLNGGIDVGQRRSSRFGGLSIAFFLTVAGIVGFALFFPGLALLGLCAAIFLAGISGVLVLYGALREDWGRA